MGLEERESRGGEEAGHSTKTNTAATVRKRREGGERGRGVREWEGSGVGGGGICGCSTMGLCCQLAFGGGGTASGNSLYQQRITKTVLEKREATLAGPRSLDP